jgi:hypothetical protein
VLGMVSIVFEAFDSTTVIDTLPSLRSSYCDIDVFEQKRALRDVYFADDNSSTTSPGLCLTFTDVY